MSRINLNAGVVLWGNLSLIFQTRCSSAGISIPKRWINDGLASQCRHCKISKVIRFPVNASAHPFKFLHKVHSPYHRLSILSDFIVYSFWPGVKPKEVWLAIGTSPWRLFKFWSQVVVWFYPRFIFTGQMHVTLRKSQFHSHHNPQKYQYYPVVLNFLRSPVNVNYSLFNFGQSLHMPVVPCDTHHHICLVVLRESFSIRNT